jgi:hypothetical protein
LSQFEHPRGYEDHNIVITADNGIARSVTADMDVSVVIHGASFYLAIPTTASSVCHWLPSQEATFTT